MHIFVAICYAIGAHLTKSAPTSARKRCYDASPAPVPPLPVHHTTCQTKAPSRMVLTASLRLGSCRRPVLVRNVNAQFDLRHKNGESGQQIETTWWHIPAKIVPGHEGYLTNKRPLARRLVHTARPHAHAHVHWQPEIPVPFTLQLWARCAMHMAVMIMIGFRAGRQGGPRRGLLPISPVPFT